MAGKEKTSAAIFLSERNPFDLTMMDARGTHRLSIEEPGNFGQGVSEESQDLMRTMLLAHLVAPEMPSEITTNTDFKFTEVLEELYRYYGEKKPRILKVGEQVSPQDRGDIQPQEIFEVATSHSGGLDSTYRIAKLLEQNQVPLAIHLKNLNPKGNAWESRASEQQCRDWEVPYISVRVKNGSGNTGLAAMKTRDLLLGLTAAIQAMPFGVKSVLIEGGMGQDKNDYHFSENSEIWSWFNQLMKATGLNLEVVGVDPGDVETVGEVLELERTLGLEMIPMVQNCFSAPFQLSNNRKKWERETPEIARNSSGHWCGSCIKCRRMTLGRIFYQDFRFNNVSKNEIAYFVKDTYDWMKKYTNNADLISESFLKHLSNI